MYKMTKKIAGKLYRLYLNNITLNYTLDDIFSMYFAEKLSEYDQNGNKKPIDPVIRQKEFNEFKRLIEEAKEQGLSGYEIANFLEAQRDTIDCVRIDEKGNEEIIATFEGDPKFDPSGKTDLTPLTGSPDFQFGDNSVNKQPIKPVPNASISTAGVDSPNVDPRNIPVFDDSETNDLKIVKPGEKEDIDFPNSNPNISDDDDFGQGGPGGIGL